MIFSTLASVASNCPAVVGSCGGFCDQSTVARGASGEEVERHIRRTRQEVPCLQLRTDPMRHKSVDQFPAHGIKVRAGTQIKDFDSESSWIQTDGHRRREFECLDIDLRTDIRNLADRNAAELDRRSRREPTDRAFENELVSLRIAWRRIEGLGPVTVQGED